MLGDSRSGRLRGCVCPFFQVALCACDTERRGAPWRIIDRGGLDGSTDRAEQKAPGDSLLLVWKNFITQIPLGSCLYRGSGRAPFPRDRIIDLVYLFLCHARSCQISPVCKCVYDYPFCYKQGRAAALNNLLRIRDEVLKSFKV